jgi:hypothetical protein
MKDIVIVTGASSNHFNPLKNLLYTISIFEPSTRTVVYDLGLKAEQVVELEKAGWKITPFPFEKYPPHLNIKVNRGEYAWKPVIIAGTAKTNEGGVLWLDSGDLLVRKLDRTRQCLKNNGFYSPTSQGNIRRWTHPLTLQYLGVSPDLLDKPNRNGAMVGFNLMYPGIPELLERWKQCALDVQCIAPPGSSRSNHRQDQAVLSVLVYQMQAKQGLVLENKFLDVSVHNDGRTFEEVQKWCMGSMARV